MQAVLTETLAKRMFGNTPARGKTFTDGGNLYTVTGVMRDVPPNTHLKFDMLVSFSSLVKLKEVDENSWNGNNNYTYVELLPHADLAAFNRKLEKLSREKVRKEKMVAAPMKDIHLLSHKPFEPEMNGDLKTVQFLTIVAIMVLLVGAVNYINLTTARSAERMKETGIRKALGSSRISLIRQFMTENVLMNLLALALALLIAALLLPRFAAITGRPIGNELFSTPSFWLTAAAIFLFSCLASGFYPAFVLSAVSPASVTRRMSTSSPKGVLFRKVLVTGQFTAALIVLSASLIVFRQLSHMRNQDLGVNAEEVLVVRNLAEAPSDSFRHRQREVFLNSVRALPYVQHASASGSLPGVSLYELNTMSGLSQYGSDKGNGYNFYDYKVDSAFLPLMNLKLLAGRNFLGGEASGGEIIISREAARLFGFSSPAAAVGGRINLQYYNRPYSIIAGVVEDYHQQSLKGAILPMINRYAPLGDQALNFYAIRLHTPDIRQSVAQIERIWTQLHPGYPFEYHFMNQLFDEQYKADDQFGKIVTIFSGFTLFITCLGILGLTAYNITRRSKEIGIRKVLGASVGNIVGLLSRGFIGLVAISLLIATPLTWYVMDRWLQDFTYRISIQWWIFGTAGLFIMIIAMLTVGVQSIKAALVNPVTSLRSE